jgi:hypothetical protein
MACVVWAGDLLKMEEHLVFLSKTHPNTCHFDWKKATAESTSQANLPSTANKPLCCQKVKKVAGCLVGLLAYHCGKL